jgi:cysteinyl-tRNA synthetase|tara:strand:+ start:12329 stop:13732 length:1404 start_codon:yes stop_codon:yes gene_type:complete
MQLHLHNTSTKANEPVIPIDGQTYRFYCCGPTVYGPAHIGNFRTFVLQDLFRRVLEGLGTSTYHVRNITDVDDKTIRGATAEGATLKAFTKKWQDAFEADSEGLNIIPPHVSPSAIEHIPEQIELISALIAKDLAYQAENGSVYFRISAFDDYGKLSGLQMDGMRQNADQRLNESDEYDKESWNDFAIWKSWKEEDGANRWESPWGPGRPGWHTECSAMIKRYLGDSFDLHSGGVDLVFPHHENEIAQSCGAHGGHFAKHWFHIAHLRVEGQKMSKSLGNLHTLEEIKGWGYTGSELRYVLISGHYRQPLNFTRDSLGGAQNAMKRLRKTLAALNPSNASLPDSSDWGRFSPVIEALCDDLNTSKAFGQLHTGLADLDKAIKAGLSPEVALAEAAALSAVLDILGLDPSEEAEANSDIPAEVIALAEQRQAARSAKDWPAADAARDAIKAAGYQLQEGPDGYKLLPL